VSASRARVAGAPQQARSPRLATLPPAAQLELVPALAPPSLTAHGQRLRLPGLGGRYVAGVARHAVEHGWDALAAEALVAALEERSRVWLLAGSLAALERSGLLARRGPLPARGARWDGRRWRPSGRRQALREARLAAGERGGLLLAASSGAPPRRLLGALEAVGARRGSLAAELATSWAVELLVTPRLSDAGLAALRERLAAAPRCHWCGVPAVGDACARCRGQEP
jgi:hypothetical protein